MQPAAALVLLLLLPQPETKTYKLAYTFRKGDEYTDSTKRHVKLEIIRGKSLAVFEIDSNEILQRTIEEAEHGRPLIERVVVKDFTRDTKKHPEQNQIGTDKSGAIGRTFVWRRVNDERWGLFGRRAEETANFKPVVERLKNWRDKRLPKDPIKVGESWKVPIADYLSTVGQPIPKGAQGNIDFKLESVDENGVAKITFGGTWTYTEPGTRIIVTQEGEWLFDAERGRDLEIKATGKIDMSGDQEGKGTLEMERVVKWKEAK